MHGKKPLVQDCDKIYIYDGTLAGFYTCVHEAVYAKERPTAIVEEKDYQPTLYFEKTIETNMEKASKVRKSITDKISAVSLKLCETVFIGCYPQKEMIIFDYLILGYGLGANTHTVLAEPIVGDLLKAESRIMFETHLYKGFTRFSDHDGVLVGIIEAKYFILPFIMKHFTQRLYNEDFMLYDKKFKSALIYHKGEYDIVNVEEFSMPEQSEDEAMYQGLWKDFYNTIAIKERINPKLRMNNMRKRFWKYMPEMQDLL